MKGTKVKTKQRPLPSLDELSKRPSLNISEAMRLSGYCRGTVDKLIEDKEWRTFPEGKRTRVITQSIYDRQDRLATESAA